MCTALTLYCAGGREAFIYKERIYQDMTPVAYSVAQWVGAVLQIFLADKKKHFNAKHTPLKQK
jgi:hypothetical protein